LTGINQREAGRRDERKWGESEGGIAAGNYNVVQGRAVNNGFWACPVFSQSVNHPQSVSRLATT